MSFVRRHPLLFLLAFSVLSAAFSYGLFFGPVEEPADSRTIVVAPDETLPELAARLKEEGLIRSVWAFEFAFVREKGSVLVSPGGFTLSPAYDAWKTATVLTDSPYFAWIEVPRARRKEEIAELLAEKLSWDTEQKHAWLSASDAWGESFEEGVYFPDTYLIPSDAAPQQVAQIMRSRFEEKFAPFAEEAAKQNIRWQTVVKMASLIEREAAGPHDMPLIAGIMWNRLDIGMRLQIDATLQYAKGNEEDGWWRTVKSEDKYIESDFNTYQNEGLPPAPIANPGLNSIKAVLYPEATSCYYYLHDYDGDIHCSANYAGHVANVREYLQ